VEASRSCRTASSTQSYLTCGRCSSAKTRLNKLWTKLKAVLVFICGTRSVKTRQLLLGPSNRTVCWLQATVRGCTPRVEDTFDDGAGRRDATKQRQYCEWANAMISDSYRGTPCPGLGHKANKLRRSFLRWLQTVTLPLTVTS
jgi:hypothetical protein